MPLKRGSMPDLAKNRTQALNRAQAAGDGKYVLYWMTAARRTAYNFGLERAAHWARELGKPLVVLEALRAAYPHASRRLHAFILEGMAQNQAALAKTPARYHPYVEPQPDAGKGLLAALAEQACVVVADWYPCFFIPHMLESAAKQVGVRLEAVDSCGLLPLSATEKDYPTAYSFRRFLQKALPGHLAELPSPDPLKGLKLPQAKLPRTITKRWPPAPAALLAGDDRALARLPIAAAPDKSPLPGGQAAARERLADFIAHGLARYADEANQPTAGAVSGLSPYLHFGHISAQEIFLAVAEAEGWAPHRLAEKATGKRAGWWGMGPGAETFLDQLITWRELGYVFCQHRPDYAQYGSLPDWARKTLAEHTDDPRPYVYSLDELEQARTHDALWNAAQSQLLREGVIHNYLRMLWGKKILEWSENPRQALERMVLLNDRYALDGRDPNSYSGVFWCLGRFDRAWGPERPVFGKVRYMTSANTARKLRVGDYLEKYGG